MQAHFLNAYFCDILRASVLENDGIPARVKFNSETCQRERGLCLASRRREHIKKKKKKRKNREREKERG